MYSLGGTQVDIRRHVSSGGTKSLSRFLRMPLRRLLSPLVSAPCGISLSLCSRFFIRFTRQRAPQSRLFLSVFARQINGSTWLDPGS